MDQIISFGHDEVIMDDFPKNCSHKLAEWIGEFILTRLLAFRHRSSQTLIKFIFLIFRRTILRWLHTHINWFIRLQIISPQFKFSPRDGYDRDKTALNMSNYLHISLAYTEFSLSREHVYNKVPRLSTVLNSMLYNVSSMKCWLFC